VSTGITITQSESAYPEISEGGSGENLTPFGIAVASDFACGQKIALTLAVKYQGGAEEGSQLNLTLPTGMPKGAQATNDVSSDIPDDDNVGITSLIMIDAESDAVVSENFNIDINLTHTYIGDLKVVLEAPSGKKVVLHNESGGGADNIVGNFPGTLAPAQPFTALVGEPIDGEWKLHVQDSSNEDKGILKSWTINDITGYECE
jgi:subtilisin-like proprotein convertase family protein